MLITKFHAGIRKSESDFWPPLLKQPIKFGLNMDNYFNVLFTSLKSAVSRHAVLMGKLEPATPLSEIE